MKKILFALTLCTCLGCENQGGLRSRDAGALGGAALGAGLGAIVGNQTGSTGAGIAIGSAIGALSGGLIGNSVDNQNDTLEARRQRLEDQERQLQENKKLIEELRSRGADARGTSRGVVVNLPDVLFQFGSAKLTQSAEDTAREISRVIRDSTDRHISVEGHTDSVGTFAYNQRLSDDRARAVTVELIANGVARKRISSRGFGEGDPVASNNTEEGRQRNRRVEVIIENR